MSLQETIHRLATRWIEHDNVKSAAAIAFFALFTLAPTLVFAVAAASWFVGATSAENAALDRVTEIAGSQAADLAQAVIASASFLRHGLLANVVSGILLIYGASATFIQLRSALDTIFGTNHSSDHPPLLISLYVRLLGAGCVIVVGIILVSALVLDVFLGAASHELRERLGMASLRLPLVGNLWSVPLVTLLYAAMLRLLPAKRPRWRHVLPGVLVGVPLFVLGKWLIAVYLGHSVIASAYGPSSSVVAVVLWIYYSAQIFLLGAEVSRAAIDREDARAGDGRLRQTSKV